MRKHLLKSVLATVMAVVLVYAGSSIAVATEIDNKELHTKSVIHYDLTTEKKTTLEVPTNALPLEQTTEGHVGNSQHGIMPTAIIDGDDRREVGSASNTFPFSTVCYIMNDTSHYGSGVMVGPNIVLTCAHVLMEPYNGGEASIYPNLRVAPGRYGANTPYGVANVSEIYFPEDYRQNEWKWDWAILVLDTPIGNESGWLGLKLTTSRLTNKSVVTLGYPQGHNQSQFYSYGQISKDTDWLLYYDCDTEGGNSGGPILDFGTNQILGINLFQDTDNPPTYNGGVKLSSLMCYFITNLLDTASYRTVAGDFNGDGFDDMARMVYHKSVNGDDGIQLIVNRSTASSFTSGAVWYEDAGEYLVQNADGRVVSGDFNGDGRDDIAAIYDYYNNRMQIHVFLSTGTGFRQWQTWLNYMTPGDFKASSVTNRVVAGDFNNDGKDDIATMYDFGNDTMKMLVFPSTGSSFKHHEEWGVYMDELDYRASAVSGRMVAGDFNNDGKDDVATLYDYGNDRMQIHTFLSTGSKFQTWQTWHSEMTPGWFRASLVTGRMAAGDFNGDGKDDIAALYGYQDDTMKLFVFPSTGSSFSGGDTWYSELTPGYYRADSITGRMVAGDFNGDGLDDIAARYDYLDGSMKNQVFRSLGNSFAKYQNWSD